jgi:uncharacterized coiled-coil protein SlyX
MNYMNVLSDFEIRLRKWFPDTAEQDQIFKLGAQVIEKDMLIEKQTEEIAKLTKRVSRIRPALKRAEKKVSDAAAKDVVVKEPLKKVKKPVKKVAIKPAKKSIAKSIEKTLQAISPENPAPVKPAVKTGKSKKSE